MAKLLRPVNTVGDATIGGQAVGVEGPLQIKRAYFCYTVDNADTKDAEWADIAGEVHIRVFGEREPTGDRAALSRPQGLISAADVLGGRARLDTTTGGTAYVTLPILFGQDHDDSCLFLRQGQRALFYVPRWDDTDVGANGVSCAVYVEEDPDAVARYNLIHLDQQITLGGLRRVPLTRDGLMGLVISEGSSENPDSFALLDGNERLIWGDWEDFLGVFQSSARIEGDMVYPDVVLDPTARGQSIWTAVHNDLTLELQGGSGTITVYQMIQDRHLGGALRESLAHRAGMQQDVRNTLRDVGESAEITEALVPKPSVNPSISQSAQISQGSGSQESAPIPRPKRTTLPVQRPQRSVLKSFN
jgi:hypothetical protein